MFSLCRLNDEKKGRKAIEKDLEDMKKSIEDTKLSRKQTQKEIDLVKEELARLDQEHKDVRLQINTKTNTSRSTNKQTKK